MICQATKDDARMIAQLAVQMWASHTVDELKDEFDDLIAEENVAIFLCYSNEKAIGFAQCQLRSDYVEGTETSPVGYLEAIFVLEEYRRRGYAKALLTACEQWSREQGCLEFASDCELDNTLSRNFHLGNGFNEVNRIICFTKRLWSRT